MSEVLTLTAIAVSLVTGLLVMFGVFRSRKSIFTASFLFSAGISLLSFGALLAPSEELVLFSVTEKLVFLLSLDSAGRFFTAIIAALWPLTVLYACTYMEHEEHLPMFFGFFLMSFGVTLGIAASGNLFTMYCFYELLTLSTVGLVLQPFTKAAEKASAAYLVYSLSGAAFGFLALMFLTVHFDATRFLPGGIIGSMPAELETAAGWIFLLGFLGFGVKAAVFPFYRWLPMASVAPTPVTALLHAVAVVKAGAFAVIRLVYYCFGAEVMSGTRAQTAALLIAAFTIVFGSSMAVRESHFKLRLAYSTVANLSYILFAALLMSNDGLTAGFLHMAVHASVKILAFFCAGAVLHMTGKTSIYQLEGIGKTMPVTFACFTVSALSLTGIPLFSGFISKWYILTAALRNGSAAALLGSASLILSALLTAVYMFTVVRRAYFGVSSAGEDSKVRQDPDWKMLVPMVLLSIFILCTGIWGQPLLEAAMKAAGGF